MSKSDKPNTSGSINLGRPIPALSNILKPTSKPTKK